MREVYDSQGNQLFIGDIIRIVFDNRGQGIKEYIGKEKRIMSYFEGDLMLEHNNSYIYCYPENVMLVRASENRIEIEEPVVSIGCLVHGGWNGEKCPPVPENHKHEWFGHGIHRFRGKYSIEYSCKMCHEQKSGMWHNDNGKNSEDEYDNTVNNARILDIDSTGNIKKSFIEKILSLFHAN